jgi:hypothetical protein
MKSVTPYLEKAISSARGPKPTDETAGIVARIDRLTTLEASMLPIEEEAKRGLRSERSEMNGKLGKILRQKEVEEEIGRLPYQVIDPIVFTWRDDDGFPRLAPFSLNSPDCVISSSGQGEVIPNSCRRFYQDVREWLNQGKFEKKTFVPIFFFLGYWLYATKVLGKWFWGGWDNLHSGEQAVYIVAILGGIPLAFIALQVTSVFTGKLFGTMEKEEGREWFINARFEGVIPQSVRLTIQQAIDSKHFQEVFILAEVPKWKMDVRLVPQPILHGDPLVVGWDGKNMRLIAAFDTTPLEQLIAAADEFTVTS